MRISLQTISELCNEYRRGIYRQPHTHCGYFTNAQGEGVERSKYVVDTPKMRNKSLGERAAGTTQNIAGTWGTPYDLSCWGQRRKTAKPYSRRQTLYFWNPGGGLCGPFRRLMEATHEGRKSRWEAYVYNEPISVATAVKTSCWHVVGGLVDKHYLPPPRTHAAPHWATDEFSGEERFGTQIAWTDCRKSIGVVQEGQLHGLLRTGSDGRVGEEGERATTDRRRGWLPSISTEGLGDIRDGWLTLCTLDDSLTRVKDDSRERRRRVTATRRASSDVQLMNMESNFPEASRMDDSTGESGMGRFLTHRHRWLPETNTDECMEDHSRQH